MTIIAYALMWIAMIATSWAFDTFVWLRHIRPTLQRRFGWPAVRPDERIPPAAAAFGGGAAFILLFVLPLVGVSAGY